MYTPDNRPGIVPAAGSFEIDNLSFEERVRRKLEEDFKEGFYIEVSEHERRPLVGFPNWFVDCDKLEAGFTTRTEDGNMIEVWLYESRHQSGLLPRAYEVHGLTFSLKSPLGEELDYVLVDKFPGRRISVQGVKMSEPLEEVFGLKLKPRLTQQDKKEFFQNYLDSLIDPEETHRRFKEKLREYRDEAEKNARLSGGNAMRVTAFYQGSVINI